MVAPIRLTVRSLDAPLELVESASPKIFASLIPNHTKSFLPIIAEFERITNNTSREYIETSFAGIR